MMASTIDPAEISNFLSNLQRSREDGLPVIPHNVPLGRYATSVRVSEPKQQRPHHALPAERGVPSWGGSSATEISIIFDNADDRSVFSTSTTYSRQGPEPMHLQPPPVPMSVTQRLPCEFNRFARCDETFGLYQVGAWVQHIVDRHLNGMLPTHCICWFCDEAKFTAQSGDSEDRAACYLLRMRHIAGHFRDGWRADQRRPDFFFLDHVHDNRLISEDVFESERHRSEMPKLRGITINTTPPMTRPVGDFIVEGTGRSRRRESGWANSQSRRL